MFWTLIIIFFSFLFLTSVNIYYILIWFFFAILRIRINIRLIRFRSWLVYMILIFLVGGLIISFSYIVRIAPNWRRLSYKFSSLRLLRVLYTGENYKINKDIKINVFLVNENINLNFSFVHYKWTLYLLIVLVLILIYVDKVIASVKGFHR